MQEFILTRNIITLEQSVVKVPCHPQAKIIDVKQEFPNVALILLSPTSSYDPSEDFCFKTLRIVRTGETITFPTQTKYLGSVVHLASTFSIFEVS